MTNKIQDVHQAGRFTETDPTRYQPADLKTEEVIINLGPQHPATHGILRLEVVADGERITQVVPHMGYLHRCFEKHASQLPYNQVIPFVDRMDYIAAMNSEHAFVMGIEQLLGLTGKLPERVEYIRVLVAELNRIASHFLAIGTYGMDLGATTAFMGLMRDREYILRLLESLTGARMLYNYIWIGGLYHDLPVGFEDDCDELIQYFKKKWVEMDDLLVDNFIFIQRTARVGILPLATAINYGVSGPMLRASGLRLDLRRVDGYSVYPALDFDIPIGEGRVGALGDCWDRTWVRAQECKESVRIIEQCLHRLRTDLKASADFDVRKYIPKKVRLPAVDCYTRAENPRGELGFFFRTTDRADRPIRCKARSSSFSNLSVIEAIGKNQLLADLIAIVGSLDIVLGEIDR